MRHAQRALLVLIERMFFDGHELTQEQRDDLATLPYGAVREAFRVFTRATFGDEEIDAFDQERLFVIAEQLHLSEEQRRAA